MGQKVTQARITEQTAIDRNQTVERFALFNDDGSAAVVPQDGAQLPFTPLVLGTAIGTVAKTTVNPEPAANTLVLLKFTNGNSAASPTIAFNGGPARAIHLGGSAVAAAELALAAGGIALFFFDGTVLHQIGAYT